MSTFPLLALPARRQMHTHITAKREGKRAAPAAPTDLPTLRVDVASSNCLRRLRYEEGSVPPGTFTYRTGMAFGQRQVDEVKREHWVGRLVAGLVAVGIRHNPPRLHQHIALLLMEAHEQGTKRAIWQFLLNPFGLCRGPLSEVPLSEVIEAELPFLTPLFELKDGTPVNWSAIPVLKRQTIGTPSNWQRAKRACSCRCP